MTAVDTEGTLYVQQEAYGPYGGGYKTEGQVVTFAMGKAVVLYSQLLAATAGGTGDTVSFMKLPVGTIILDGQLYIENGLGGTDDDTASLGIIYEDGDGSDDSTILNAAFDIYDGADTAPLGVAALPTGFMYYLPQHNAGFPYIVAGGIGTVTLTTLDGAIVTAKDMKLWLTVLIPGA